MNYIGLLTKEEKSTLCEIITGKEFKELFKRNEQEFSKIQKGFRANVGLSNTLYRERFKEGSQFFFGREPGQGAHR